MTLQRALFLTAKHGEWKVEDRPIPNPGKGQVLIKVHSTALNPIDWKIQKTGRFVQNYPAVLGCDSAGEVAGLGEGVTSFVQGDRVLHQGWLSSDDLATFQQYALCPAELISKVPDPISFDEASTIPLCLGTAFVGLYNPADKNGINLTPFWVSGGRGKYKNQPIVIFGGSSSVGQFAIQGARLSGFDPIITTSSLKHEEFLKDLGATVVLDRSDRKLTKEIMEALLGKPAEVVVDTIASEETQCVALGISSASAQLLLTGDKKSELDFGERVVVRAFGALHVHREIATEIFQHLFSLLQDGHIKPNRAEVIDGGLESIPQGLERLRRNEVSGIKLVVHPWE